LEGGRLRYRLQGITPSDALRTFLREHKVTLTSLLAVTPTAPVPTPTSLASPCVTCDKYDKLRDRPDDPATGVCDRSADRGAALPATTDADIGATTYPETVCVEDGQADPNNLSHLSHVTHGEVVRGETTPAAAGPDVLSHNLSHG